MRSIFVSVFCSSHVFLAILLLFEVLLVSVRGDGHGRGGCAVDLARDVVFSVASDGTLCLWLCGREGWRWCRANSWLRLRRLTRAADVET